ncbi:MAG: RuvX/YqgF family protein [bacterium]|nr:RuvX/YqgF family protein [bacterium]
MMRYLGIDYGEKRVGVAISDETNTLALPKAVLPNDAALIPTIQSIIKEESISDVVIGESNDRKNTPNPIMKRIAKFKEVLGHESNVAMHYESEFYTSIEAERLQGKSAMGDASAAALILKSFLEKKHDLDRRL